MMSSKSTIHTTVIVQFLYFSLVLASFSNSPKKAYLPLKDYEPDIEPYDDSGQTEKPIFNYRKNGFRVDIRIVPAKNNSENGNSSDHFPDIPVKEIGRCIIDLSMTCVQKRVVRFLDVVKQLKEITLFGQAVKMVRTKVPKPVASDRSLTLDGLKEKIDRNIDDFFETFVLRITLPKWNGNNNQINLMFDDTDVEGRGKKTKGGGKCKKMMMCMMMMVKMKLMGMVGMMAMKGMIFSGMSLMMSKAMLIQKLMSLKGGGGFGGGGGYGGGGYGGGHGGGGQYKEVVLLTKSSGDSGCGGGGGGSGCHSQDSYAAPPSSSYGAPSSSYGPPSGGGYPSSGGGWGRSFNNQPTTTNLNNPQQFNPVPLIGEAVSNFVHNLNANVSSQDRHPNSNSNTTFVKTTDRNDILSNHRDKYDERIINYLKPNNQSILNHRQTYNQNDPNNTLSVSNLQPVYVQNWRNYNSSKILSILYPNTLEEKSKV